MKSMTKTSNKLEVALILHKIQEDRAKDLYHGGGNEFLLVLL